MNFVMINKMDCPALLTKKLQVNAAGCNCCNSPLSGRINVSKRSALKCLRELQKSPTSVSSDSQQQLQYSSTFVLFCNNSDIKYDKNVRILVSLKDVE